MGELAPRLAARGFDVRAYSTDLYREFPWERLGPEVPRHEMRNGVAVRRLRAWSMPGELHYPFFRGLQRALAEDRPDLLHVHTYGTNHAAIARRHSRRFHVPYVITAHFHPIWSIEGGWLRHRVRGFYDRRLAAPIVAGAARLIVQSQEEERLIRVNRFPLPKVELIPPGYTPLPEPPPGERPFARSQYIEGPFVLFAGRLASNKGLIPLIDAFEPLARHDPTATLVLVGEDGGMRARVQERVRERGLGARVRITGYLTDERLLSAAFREARLCVLPSEYEAFGLVLLEALAQGTPVIASRVGGIPEFVEDGRAGVLVPPLEVAPLSDALLALWDDEPRRLRLGEYGRRETVPRYSWDRLADRLSTMYREVLDG
ncbi:MAG: glycosyltransferase family 4 protein [Thermoplasmata archaeon]|nr:glycosyltransferase family 4 protein [Thermoplasmata archaeon]